MTDHLPIIGDYAEDDTGARRRGFWGLAAIALVAAAIVVILGLVLDHKSAPSTKANPNLITNFTDGASPISSPSSTVPATSGVPTTRSSAQSSKSATASASTSKSSSASVRSPTPTATKTKATPPPTPTHTTSPSPFGPCPSVGACELSDDYGTIKAIQSVYAPDATGTVSPAAKGCALAKGSDPSQCGSQNYVFVVETSTNAAQAVSEAAADAPWLRHGVTSFQVGWAYEPTSRQYFFAILEGG